MQNLDQLIESNLPAKTLVCSCKDMIGLLQRHWFVPAYRIQSDGKARRRSFTRVKHGTVDWLENVSDSFAIFILTSLVPLMVPNAPNFSSLLQLVAMVSSKSPWFLPIRHSFNSTFICLTCCYFVKRKTSRGSLRKTRWSQICTRNNKKNIRLVQFTRAISIFEPTLISKPFLFSL